MADPMTRDAMGGSVFAAHMDPCDIYLPMEVTGELMRCAANNGRISYEYLCAIYRKGKADALRAAPPADRRINTRCPSCGSATLFLDDHGHLVCSLIGCKEPVVERAVAVLKAAPPADAGAPPCIGHDPLCPCQDGDSCHYRDTADTRAMQRPDAGAPPALVALREKWDNYRLRYPNGWSQERQRIDEFVADLDTLLGTPAPPAAPPALSVEDAHAARSLTAAPPAVQVGEPMPAIGYRDGVIRMPEMVVGPPARRVAGSFHCDGGSGHGDPDNSGLCINCGGVSDGSDVYPPDPAEDARVRRRREGA